MVGVEYILLHVQDPILYVIRKQHRHSPSEATPMADYYIIAGTVYQAPDLASVFNSRLLSTVHQLQSAFEEASSYAKYHPSKGYTWDFSTNKASECILRLLRKSAVNDELISVADKTKTQNKKEAPPVKEEQSSIFQRQRVDMLLSELLRKFPPPIPNSQQSVNAVANANAEKAEPSEAKNEQQTIKTENVRSETNKKDTDNVVIKQEPIDQDPSSPMNVNTNIEIKQEIKSEIMKPPEKKMKLG